MGFLRRDKKKFNKKSIKSRGITKWLAGSFKKAGCKILERENYQKFNI